MAKHLPKCQVFKIVIPDIEVLRPQDMAGITANYAGTEPGRWLVEHSIDHDIVMSGLDYIGEVYVLIFDENDAMQFKLAFA